MRHFGNGSEYKDDRDSELFRVYHNIISECSCIKLDDVIKEVVNTPSSRFWVSEERADAVVFSILKGKGLDSIKGNTKREMFSEIYARVIQLRDAHPDWQRSRLVFEVVNQQAPKFYITPKSAKVILHYAKRRFKKVF